jgi:hypothetical protein
MTNSTTNIETTDAVERAEMRSLSDAELDTVAAGCTMVAKEIKCPIGNLLVVYPVGGSNCNPPAVAYYPR